MPHLLASHRNREMKRSPLAGRGVEPDASSVPFHNSLADGQTNTSSFILFPRIQPLKHLENPPRIFHLHSDAVVSHGKLAETIGLPPLNLDPWRLLCPELQCVLDQILKHLSQLPFIDHNRRQRAAHHLRSAAVNRLAHQSHNRSQNGGSVGWQQWGG